MTVNKWPKPVSLQLISQVNIYIFGGIKNTNLFYEERCIDAKTIILLGNFSEHFKCLLSPSEQHKFSTDLYRIITQTPQRRGVS